MKVFKIAHFTFAISENSEAFLQVAQHTDASLAGEALIQWVLQCIHCRVRFLRGGEGIWQHHDANRRCKGHKVTSIEDFGLDRASAHRLRHFLFAAQLVGPKYLNVDAPICILLNQLFELGRHDMGRIVLILAVAEAHYVVLRHGGRAYQQRCAQGQCC